VAFRFNEQNERRMGGEFLRELRATVKRNCGSLDRHPSFANLEGSNLIATIGSHDNPQETITEGDIDVALNDINELTALFTCEDCGRCVEASQKVAGKDEISCKCGQKVLDWRQ
jgi:DNA-directed RNA polymerase subunit RPC12/RpoP